MNVWFEGSQEIDCSLDDVERAIANHGELYLGIVTGMPGMKDVELIEQDDGSVTIKTNEGFMKRINIVKRITEKSVVVELDETYKAGSMVTTTSHFLDEFTASAAGIKHRLVISNLEAPGFLGFFYRQFGASSTGKAFLAAYKNQLGGPRTPPNGAR